MGTWMFRSLSTQTNRFRLNNFRMISNITGGLSVWDKKIEEVRKATKVVAPVQIVMGSKNWPPAVPTTMTKEERFKVITSVGCECIQPEELKVLLEKKPHPVCYDGFEPSGRMHVAQGLLKAINVNKLTSAGCIFVFYIADWFALMNNKMGGDLKKIQKVGEYFIEVWKASGMDMRNVRFVWASSEINDNSNDYWLRVLDISRHSTISRVKRCGQIMGRSEGDDQPAAQILYPCMQAADIFQLKADICQLGLDQRKVNMLARDYCESVKLPNRPIVISHAMMKGLKEGQEKASKSDPLSAIFMEDAPSEISSKIKKAFCPEKEVDNNPVVEHITRIVIPAAGKFEISRSEANGGDVTFTSEEEFIEAYKRGDLHPGDVKPALAKALNALLEPVRRHFETDPHAKQVLAAVKSYKITK
eukprot:GDKK01064739.1.p1 GENE.GDKK01064739.1~~GDKK01064739.1.p1  ORF type:complete len:417 (-),score=137.23 GDKK01064739.1:77-1327(-)